MNKLEARYERQLDMLKHVGVIADYRFECIKLRLGPNWLTGYTPDFLVILPDGLIEVHEVKGFWEDDARVKIKTAAGLFPFRFIAVTEKKGGGWAREVFYPEV
ncbi:MAG TPA: DUF1064 domain-containing protein [Aurantimonas coralicida]|nr:DUF1064 domain-containing protein [Aurantimonas coralicida]